MNGGRPGAWSRRRRTVLLASWFVAVLALLVPAVDTAAGSVPWISGVPRAVVSPMSISPTSVEAMAVRPSAVVPPSPIVRPTSIGPPVLVPTAARPLPDLSIVTAARYDVQPVAHRVRITVDATIANNRVDTKTTRYYFDTAVLAVLPGAKAFAVSSPGASPAVRVRSATATYTLLTIDLGRRLYSGHHTPLRLVFDLPDPGGAPSRDVLIGPTLASFPVWAFATASTPGSSVTVVFPAGYNVQVSAGQAPPASTDSNGSAVYRSGVLAAPLTFYWYFVADRPGAFVERPMIVRVAGDQVPLIIRAWADDPAWGTRIGSLFERGLPVLGTAIGLPYRGQGLVVEEALSRTLGGYAGLYNPQASTIEVAYFAGAFVALHEAAHAWFNGSLVADRWIGEGFASYYATVASKALKLPVTPPRLTPDLTTQKLPLNAWPGVGRSNEGVENYAYAACYRLATLIAQRAGAAGLRAVWEAAASALSAYQPVRVGSIPETTTLGPPDWRALLDLLEERTSAQYTDLWRTWVVRPDEAQLLVTRQAARQAYARAVVAAGSWELPRVIRTAMASWQFGQATSLFALARTALAKRDEVNQRAAAAGLTAPAGMQAAFEGSAGPGAAAQIGEDELNAIDLIESAAATSGRTNGLFDQIGLMGFQPDEQLARARTEFDSGDLAASRAYAAAAAEAWATAGDRGVQRIVLVSIVAVACLVLLVMGALALRARLAGRRGPTIR
ncbi:MAG TPA: hypothetical protein VNF73_03040 [Candidatus Saccharimonadales bacterium]|nr:hypothetical protein [Candidatus Saccharimonadales bacterium]